MLDWAALGKVAKEAWAASFVPPTAVEQARWEKVAQKVISEAQAQEASRLTEAVDLAEDERPTTPRLPRVPSSGA